MTESLAAVIDLNRQQSLRVKDKILVAVMKQSTIEIDVIEILEKSDKIITYSKREQKAFATSHSRLNE